MSDITIYHNPACSASRNALELIRSTGAEPEVVEYLQHPLNQSQLQALLHAMGAGPRELLRHKGPLFEECPRADPKWGDAELVAMMEKHPALMNRPVVVTPLGARLCRPAETVLDLLPKS